MTWTLLGGAWLMGLTGSPHCVGMCGGFASACATTAPRGAAYHVGRLLTYATLGAIVGGLGRALPLPAGALGALAGALVVAHGLSLGGWVRLPAPRLPWLGEAARRALTAPGALGPLLLGATTALLPCGLVYGALGLAIAAGGALGGALTLAAFGLGTVPLLAGAAAGVHRWAASSPSRRRALGLAVIAVGLASVALRAG